MRLSQYILENLEPILQEFEDFARSYTVRGEFMDVTSLRDHAEEVLKTIVRDLEQPQSDAAEVRKSKGDAPPPSPRARKTAAEDHGADRSASGFTIEEMTAEFRALRASVLRLWIEDGLVLDETALDDIMRFNEAIDQALAESVAWYSTEFERVSRTVAETAREALTEPNLQVFLSDVTRRATELLDVECARVLQFLPDERVLIVRAVTGLPDEQVDRHRVPVGPELEAWLISNWEASVKVADFADEPRNLIPLGLDFEVHSGMSIEIRGATGPWGVLQAFSGSPRKYGHGEQDFARTIAAIVSQSLERRTGEERLRFQATLLDAVGDAVMAVDLDGRVIHWNQQAEKLYGWKREEALDRSAVDLVVPKADADKALALMQRSAHGHEWAGEMRALRKDGTTVPVLANLTPVRDENGDITGHVSVSNDVSERLRFEERLRQSQKMEALGRLAGGVSHDFNNLLTTISGFAELMLDELSDDAPTREFAREIQGAAQRATGFTAQLLAFSGRKASLPSSSIRGRW